MIKPIIICGKETGYFIDTNGNIYNSDMHELTYYVSNSGYYRVTLFIGGKRTKFSVHRLMAMTFIGNISDEIVVNHLDGNKKNNAVDNLEIVTAKHNSEHASRNGLYRHGENFYRTKYPEKCIAKVCAMIQNGYPASKIAKETGFPIKKVSEIRTGVMWKSVSQNYVFPRKPSNPRIGKLNKQEERFIQARISEGMCDKDILKSFKTKPVEMENVSKWITEFRNLMRNESSTTIERVEENRYVFDLTLVE